MNKIESTLEGLSGDLARLEAESKQLRAEGSSDINAIILPNVNEPAKTLQKAVHIILKQLQSKKFKQAFALLTRTVANLN